MTQATSDDWQKVNWRKLRQDLFRLQKRIFKAVQGGDMARAKRLQKLVMNSHAAQDVSNPTSNPTKPRKENCWCRWLDGTKLRGKVSTRKTP